ncbi:MAG: hypothetical protein AAFV93_19655 [Chloroflexota bacterium]
MKNDFVQQQDPVTDLVLYDIEDYQRHPALVYLASLTSDNSRRMMTRHLNAIAHLLNTPENILTQKTSGRPRKIDRTFLYVAWQNLRFEQWHSDGVSSCADCYHSSS